MYISMYIQDEYRRLCVFIFVLLFTVPVLSFFLLRDVLLRLRMAEEFLFFPPDGVHIIYHYDFSLSINYYPPLTASIGYLHLPARAYIRVVIFHVFIIVLLFVNLLPFFRWLPVRLG